jgi:hypothetical protein
MVDRATVWGGVYPLAIHSNQRGLGQQSIPLQGIARYTSLSVDIPGRFYSLAHFPEIQFLDVFFYHFRLVLEYVLARTVQQLRICTRSRFTRSIANKFKVALFTLKDGQTTLSHAALVEPPTYSEWHLGITSSGVTGISLHEPRQIKFS